MPSIALLLAGMALYRAQKPAVMSGQRSLASSLTSTAT
eukprot:CAMPEP_0114628076 /NCGR_PEP_ID=MMETSP0168-20121206/12629_1 /TAXON_ID=95228 ORGANISM="Vannella sp., Strain DIVA3 517/6/12" /NCGR_SAMPLE_ID=MMETSP0168 /ASSEMBLY_ACC=CAM_ASM_000044 /LENGTH=37 /DNA_ID= /DNA_START= /DNA_END= /DNA_ORIENTATION=